MQYGLAQDTAIVQPHTISIKPTTDFDQRFYYVPGERQNVWGYRIGILINDKYKLGIGGYYMNQHTDQGVESNPVTRTSADPFTVNKQLYLGTIYYATKSYRRSITQYKRALRLTPDSASIMSNLGMSYFARKNYELAFTTFQDALKLDPDVFEHRSSMGVLLQERSVDERAKFHYYLAKTFAKAGDVSQALLYIRKALEEGFKERNKFNQDPEFASMRENPEFKQILSAEQKVL